MQTIHYFSDRTKGFMYFYLKKKTHTTFERVQSKMKPIYFLKLLNSNKSLTSTCSLNWTHIFIMSLWLPLSPTSLTFTFITSLGKNKENHMPWNCWRDTLSVCICLCLHPVKNTWRFNGLRPSFPKGINYLPNIYCPPCKASQEIPKQLTQALLSKGWPSGWGSYI